MENDRMLPFEHASEQLKLLADKSRLHLLSLLLHSELCVCDLVELTQLSQPNVSQHMRKLKFGGFVSESKKGQWVYYSLRDSIPAYVRDVLRNLPSLEAGVTALKAKNSACCVVETVNFGGLERAEKIGS